MGRAARGWARGRRRGDDRSLRSRASWFEYNGPTGTLDAPQGTLSGPGGTCDTSGASLPSLAPLGDSAALVTWYQTAVTTHEDPLQSCASAAAVPLVAAVATLSPGSASAVLAAPITLTTTSLSVRAPAMLAIGTQVVVAAPSGDDVGIWALDGNATAPPSPTSIPGLAGARAVSVATDGAGHLAVVAEIGCTPEHRPRNRDPGRRLREDDPDCRERRGCRRATDRRLGAVAKRVARELDRGERRRPRSRCAST